MMMAMMKKLRLNISALVYSNTWVARRILSERVSPYHYGDVVAVSVLNTFCFRYQVLLHRNLYFKLFDFQVTRSSKL